MSHRNANRRPTAMELARSTLGWGGLARAWGRSGGAMIVSSYQAFGGFGGGLMRRSLTPDDVQRCGSLVVVGLDVDIRRGQEI